MSTKTVSAPSGLGAGAVFLTAISTILGAVLFLRFGYAVANVGLIGTLAIIALGHVVTLPTAMAIAEIATNQRVAGGGAYHIISRSFGVVTGAAIGIALFFSQAISVSFYAIAFAESFKPVMASLSAALGLPLTDPRLVSVPATLALMGLIWWKGASLGVKSLYPVVGVLFLALFLFFIGRTEYEPGSFFDMLSRRKDNPDNFFLVFAIIFPAFTGVAAGLGLSGDLRNPKRDIPIGTLSATLVGMVVYALCAVKLGTSASPDDLGEQFVMSKIAVWAPIIPIGLACATLSSAMGSMLVAPRTLQALASDRILGSPKVEEWLRAQEPRNGEPLNAIFVTTGIALAFVLMGDVDFVAQIISMFFMVTYGAICLISFLEHFAADPAYRPAFRSRWYISLTGALACIWCMFEMSPVYAVLAILAMFSLYALIARTNPDRRGLTYMFQGAVFQFSRKLQVFAQKSTFDSEGTWRPSTVAISRDSFTRLDEFELLRWISHRYGFGTYIHHIEGYFSKTTSEQAAHDLSRLVDRAEASRSNVYVDTIVCPSSTSLIAQLVQLPGISGKANNMLLFGFSASTKGALADLTENYQLTAAVGFDVAVLAASPRGFGYRREVHVWLTADDGENSALMILLAYIIVGHPDWAAAKIRVFALAPLDQLEAEEQRLASLVLEGRLPIQSAHIEVVAQNGDLDRRDVIRSSSIDADLVILGFRGELLKRVGDELFEGYDGMGNVLFVNTQRGVELERPEEEPPEEPEQEPEQEPAQDSEPAAQGALEAETREDPAASATEPAAEAESDERPG